MNRKPLWIVILILSLVVLLAGAGFLLYYFFGGSASPQRNATDETRDIETIAESTSATALPSAVPEPQTESVDTFGYTLEDTPDVTTLSFDELMAMNPDVYAWIYVPNTNIDYPVVQSMTDGDDSFYLSHNVYREYQFSGCIYSEIQNATDFHDPVTVLYGHNMANGSMFATLHYFSDPEFFNANNTAFIITKDRVLTYLIYSAYLYDDRHILNSFNMRDRDSFAVYRDSTLTPRSYNCNIREGVTLDENSRILTLSTCGSGNTRFLVQGVLVYEQDRIVE